MEVWHRVELDGFYAGVIPGRALACDERLVLLRELRMETRRQNEAATMIQRVVRGRQARANVSSLRFNKVRQMSIPHTNISHHTS